MLNCLKPEEIDYLVTVAEEGEYEPDGWPAWWEQHRDGLRERLPLAYWWRLEQYGGRASYQVLRHLRIPYTKPNWGHWGHKVEFPGNCHLCGGELTEEERGSYRSIDGGGGFLYQSRCERCDVDYRLKCGSSGDEQWRLMAPVPEELQRPLTAEEIAAYSADPPDAFLGCNEWALFIARGPEDELWWAHLWKETSIVCRVRGGVPVAQFAQWPESSDQAEADRSCLGNLGFRKCPGCGLHLLGGTTRKRAMQALKRVRGWTIGGFDLEAEPKDWQAAIVGNLLDWKCPRCLASRGYSRQRSQRDADPLEADELV